jgi:hypothetical protein
MVIDLGPPSYCFVPSESLRNLGIMRGLEGWDRFLSSWFLLVVLRPDGVSRPARHHLPLASHRHAYKWRGQRQNAVVLHEDEETQQG